MALAASHLPARAVDYSPYSIRSSTMTASSTRDLDFRMLLPLPYGPFTPPAEADMVVLARGERNPHWEAGVPRYIAERRCEGGAEAFYLRLRSRDRQASRPAIGYFGDAADDEAYAAEERFAPAQLARALVNATPLHAALALRAPDAGAGTGRRDVASTRACRARLVQRQDPRFESAPRDHRPSKHEPRRVDTGRDGSLQSRERRARFPRRPDAVVLAALRGRPRDCDRRRPATMVRALWAGNTERRRHRRAR